MYFNAVWSYETKTELKAYLLAARNHKNDLHFVQCPCAGLCLHPKSSQMSYFIRCMGEFHQVCNFAILVQLRGTQMNSLYLEVKRSKVKVVTGPSVVGKGEGIHTWLSVEF